MVPTRRTWIRCGMSEPVTKTSRSETFLSFFEAGPAGVSANEEVTDRRNRDAITGNISVFTPTKYTERVSSAISIILATCTWSAAEDGGSYNRGTYHARSPETTSLVYCQNFFVRRAYQNRFVAS